MKSYRFCASVCGVFWPQLGSVLRAKLVAKKRIPFSIFPSCAQETPKSVPRAPKSVPRAPKSVPRAPKSDQNVPRGRPRCLQRRTFWCMSAFSHVFCNFPCLYVFLKCFRQFFCVFVCFHVFFFDVAHLYVFFWIILNRS